MTLQLFANPYDITAQGFYFSTESEFETKYGAHLPVEEFEIEFIDSDDAECVLFNALKVSQTTISKFFDTPDTLGSDENRAAAVCYLLENGIAAEIDDAVGQSSDVSLFEGTVEDYA